MHLVSGSLPQTMMAILKIRGQQFTSLFVQNIQTVLCLLPGSFIRGRAGGNRTPIFLSGIGRGNIALSLKVDLTDECVHYQKSFEESLERQKVLHKTEPHIIRHIGLKSRRLKLRVRNSLHCSYKTYKLYSACLLGHLLGEG